MYNALNSFLFIFYNSVFSEVLYFSLFFFIVRFLGVMLVNKNHTGSRCAAAPCTAHVSHGALTTQRQLSVTLYLTSPLPRPLPALPPLPPAVTSEEAPFGLPERRRFAPTLRQGSLFSASSPTRAVSGGGGRVPASRPRGAVCSELGLATLKQSWSPKRCARRS